MRALRWGTACLMTAGLLWAAWLMLQLSLPYTALKRNVDFLQTKQLVYHLRHWRWSFYLHVFTAIAALLPGAVQFSKWVLHRHPRVHRAAGWTYAATVLLLAGPSALVMGFYANGGVPARISFVLLGAAWIFTTGQALRAVFARRYAVHGAWMIRSYALTVSAITLRFYAWGIDVLHIPIRPVAQYVLIAWLSWVPNLLVAEWIIRRGAAQRMLQKYR